MTIRWSSKVTYEHQKVVWVALLATKTYERTLPIILVCLGSADGMMLHPRTGLAPAVKRMHHAETNCMMLTVTMKENAGSTNL